MDAIFKTGNFFLLDLNKFVYFEAQTKYNQKFNVNN